MLSIEEVPYQVKEIYSVFVSSYDPVRIVAKILQKAPKFHQKVPVDPVRNIVFQFGGQVAV